MKLVEMKCKNCGAVLMVDEDLKKATCKYCQAEFKFDDEVQRVQYDNMEKSGYDFEKGRLRAQKEDINDAKPNVVNVNNDQRKKRGCLFYLICLMFFPFVITYFVIKSPKLDTKMKIIILTILWLFIFIVGIIGAKEEKELAENPWATECTPITNFEYYLDGEKAVLKKYTGTSKRVKVCSTYRINQKEYNVNEFSESVFLTTNIYSIILPEGLISMPANTFNSSSIKYLYIPSTLESDGKSYSFYSYFHDVKKVYYGGTKKQWSTLTNNTDRSKIDVQEIIYEAKSEDLK